MSINQYSSDLSRTQWWPHPKHLGYNANNEEDDDAAASGGEIGCAEVERLFEKSLTPSDVGKLNRLVIPKQHAEKHFPLGGGGGGEAREKGLLLGFEDEAGKSWKFRYSYWNSSQSYVLTKGWSRFVKEKRLEAGDVVVFARHRVDAGRLFIGWKRRCLAEDGASQQSAAAGNGRGGGQYAYPGQHMHAALAYQPDSICSGTVGQQQNQTISKGNSKRLRLFGVNLECYQQADESDPLGSPEGTAHQSPYHNPPPQYYYSHMDISSSEAGVYRQG